MIKKFKELVKINKESILIFFLFILTIIIISSNFFTPIIISIIFSYLLTILKKNLEKKGIKEKMSFIITYTFFITIFFLILMIIIPYILKQIVDFFNDLPFIIQKIKYITHKLLKKYPFIFPQEQMNILFSNTISNVQSIGKTIINASILSITIFIKWILYIFLIPIFIFFILKDYKAIKIWFKKKMPEKSNFLKKIWESTEKQINNYIRGKIIEIFIITIANYILFKYYNLKYYNILSFCVGLSVIIPYIGTIIISIPIILISAVQLGISNNFIYMNIIYMIIHFIDGNLLIPILFSEAVNLNSISIIITIIVFGSTLKIYGLIFAIPFAIISNAIINIYLTNK